MLKDQNLKKPTRLAALTFDDGFKNIYQYAYPFLKERKIPFTLFLTTATIDSSELLWLHKLIILLIALPFNVVNLLYSQFYNTSNKSLNIYDVINKIVSNKEKKDILRFINHVTFRIPISNETEKEIANRLYLTVDELLEMREYGLSIQAHGHEHLWLSDLSQTETYKEIYSCFQYITQILRRKPSFYGLAFGVSNPFIKEIISELGLNGIVTSERRLLDKTDDPYCLPRISVKNDNEYIYRFLTRWYLSAIMKKIKSCQFRSFILRHRKRI
ncbi:polysaccharide deacetylase family protein [Candidatus Dojkabacteria bacterium]|nr:polysaccharide deacetylase family protein [Candidatus Dojkabacteria bacterium]